MSKQTTLAVTVGNRGFFPDHLCDGGRRELLAALEREGIATVALTPEDTPFGSVEPREHAHKWAVPSRERDAAPERRPRQRARWRADAARRAGASGANARSDGARSASERGSKSRLCLVISAIGEPSTPTRDRADRILRHLIAPAAEACGYLVLRADGIPEPGLITSQVIYHLLSAELVVADLTETNPNVFYELAVRHFVGRPTVQVVEVDQRLPFHVMQSRTIGVDHRDVDSIARAREDLRRQIRAAEDDSRLRGNPIAAAMALTLFQARRRQDGTTLAAMAGVASELRALAASLDGREVTGATTAP